jgi:hypothetical protein
MRLFALVITLFWALTAAAQNGLPRDNSNRDPFAGVEQGSITVQAVTRSDIVSGGVGARAISSRVHVMGNAGPYSPDEIIFFTITPPAAAIGRPGAVYIGIAAPGSTDYVLFDNMVNKFTYGGRPIAVNVPVIGRVINVAMHFSHGSCLPIVSSAHLVSDPPTMERRVWAGVGWITEEEEALLKQIATSRLTDVTPLDEKELEKMTADGIERAKKYAGQDTVKELESNLAMIKDKLREADAQSKKEANARRPGAYQRYAPTHDAMQSEMFYFQRMMKEKSYWLAMHKYCPDISL